MESGDALTIEFVTERFDYRGELPEDANAGNRFYGRDVGEFLCRELEKAGVKAEFLDEDWGWLVLGKHNEIEPVEIAVYHWGGVEPEDKATASGTWRLRVNSWTEKPYLIFMKRRVQTECSTELASKLRSVLEDAGCRITVFGKSNDW